DLARDLEAVWDDPGCDVVLKKRLVQALIREVVADVAESGREIRLVIHWEGGVHTELRLPRRGRGQCSPTAADMVAAVPGLGPGPPRAAGGGGRYRNVR